MLFPTLLILLVLLHIIIDVVESTGGLPTATPTSKSSFKTSSSMPSIKPTFAPPLKLCQFSGNCKTSSDCVQGNNCSVINPYYSQCLPNPKTYSSAAGCLLNYGGKCSSSSKCCDPGAYCDLSLSYPQCKQPTSSTGRCTDVITKTSPSSQPTTNNMFYAVTIGNGVAGSTAMWEMAKRGIGSSSTGGLMLIERSNLTSTHVCGIIEAITFEESSGLNDSPFSNSYQPYRYTTHAMRINIAQQASMRCLANELNITLYFTPWSTDFRLNGYRSRDGMYECAPDSPIPDGSSSSCRNLCKNGHRNLVYEEDASCSTNFGQADMTLQTTSKAYAPFNLWNYAPQYNYNQGDYDAVDEFYGWALGYANYYNPTANYSGLGTAYNGASVYPFQPHNSSQDHPRHQCKRFKNLYSLYQYYVGPDYAKYLVETNAGFLADANSNTDPCTYIGSTSEIGSYGYAYFESDEGYPVGSMTEICTRQRYLAEHNTQNVPVTTVNGEAVTSIDYNDARNLFYNPLLANKGKYIVKTSNMRVLYTDHILLAAEPSAISKMSGQLIADIISQPEFKTPNPVPVRK